MVPASHSPDGGRVLKGLRSLGAIAWWIALVAWIAAIIVPGATAMVAFTRLPQLDLSMAGAEAFFGGDSEGAGRFIAGYVTNPLFLASDRVRLVCMVVLGATLATTAGGPIGRPGPARRIAIVAIGLATLVLVWYLLRISAPLASALDSWRAAVLADDHVAAESAWNLFDPLHRQASRLYGIELSLLLMATIAASMSTRAVPKPDAARNPKESPS